MAEVLTKAGLPITADDIGAYVGWTSAKMYADFERRFGFTVPDWAGQKIRSGIVDAVGDELSPMPGLVGVLDELKSGVAMCVASNGTYNRVLGTVGVLGLSDYFVPHIYSAEQVAEGKPAPDLFLHAASAFDAAPDNCLVIEDSLHGVAAALAADMTVFGFTGASHFGPDHEDALHSAGAHEVFGEMLALPELIRSIS